MVDCSGLFRGFSVKGFLGLLLTSLVSCNTVEALHKVESPDFPESVPISLRKFVEASSPNRTVGAIGHEKAFEFIKGQFDELAAATKGRVIIHEFAPDIDFAKRSYENDFSSLIKPKYPKTSKIYKRWRLFTDKAQEFVSLFQNVKGKNIILEIPGRKKPEDVVYIGAHYDTIDNDRAKLTFQPELPAPGADDNASGIAALLSLAQEFRNEHPDRTIRLVAFDYEEIFFLGSYALAKDLNSMKPRWMRPGEKTLGLVNLEMIGWSKTALDNHPVVKIYTREPRTAGVEEDMELAKSLARAAFILKSPLDFKILPNGFNRSDNWSFWQKSFPSICITQDWENDFNKDHYHSPSDTPSTLNMDYLKEITRVVTEAATEMTKGI